MKSDSVLGDLKPIMQASRDKKDRSVQQDSVNTYHLIPRALHVQLYVSCSMKKMGRSLEMKLSNIIYTDGLTDILRGDLY